MSLRTGPDDVDVVLDNSGTYTCDANTNTSWRGEEFSPEKCRHVLEVTAAGALPEAFWLAWEA